MKRILLVTIYTGLLGLIFLGLPDELLYEQENALIEVIPFMLIFIVPPIILYNILKSYKVTHNTALGIAAGSVLVIGPTWGMLQERKSKTDFAANGQPTMGIVYKKWKSGTGKREWLLRCNYQVDGKTYSTFSKADDKNKFKVGDTLTVVYSKKYPQKCMIVELEENDQWIRE